MSRLFLQKEIEKFSRANSNSRSIRVLWLECSSRRIRFVINDIVLFFSKKARHIRARAVWLDAHEPKQNLMKISDAIDIDVIDDTNGLI